MGAVLVINVSGVETRVALVENGTISEYYLERKKDKGIVGNIYKGKVVRVLPGMQAAFVDIGLEKAAFLYVNDVFYDPDFSEQQFELTEGEHAEFDDELDESIDLNAAGHLNAAGALNAEPPARPVAHEACAPQLTIMTPSLLSTPGELKTPNELNGSVHTTSQPASGQTVETTARASQADDKVESKAEDKAEVTAEVAVLCEATTKDADSASSEGESTAAPESAEKTPVEAQAACAPEEVEAADEVADASAETSADKDQADKDTIDEPSGALAMATLIAPESAAADAAVEPVAAVSDVQTAVETAEASVEAAPVESAQTADQAGVAQTGEAQAEPTERRGELRARSRRRRRGGSARREVRHDDLTAQDRVESATPAPESMTSAETVSQAAEETSEAVQPTADAAPNGDTPAEANAPMRAEADDATATAPSPCVPAEDESAATAQADVEAADSAQNAEAQPTEAAEDRASATESADSQEASQETSLDASPACAQAQEQERTPVATEPARNQGRQGRNGERERGRRGNRADKGAAETRSGDRCDDTSERGESDNGRNAKRRPAANIQDLLKVGQEIIVQVAKDPIGTKGARVTSHISIPGRQIVFMPTVDHVGISRRIEKESERRRLRDIVERIRPAGTGFIVRTVAENISTEKLEADARFLTGIWSEVVAKKDKIGAPALLHPDLDLTLRATRDLFVQDVEKLVIDDRTEWERISRFVAAQAPALKDRVVLHEGDEPIFDAYGIEHELQRAYSRKVWLKSGGYLIIDQAEALTAIDVNSGRYVGKKSLEETITRINIEAAKEIVYQLRLRNIGGIMIIDFIDMAKAQNRDKVFKALQEALGRDKARTNILKISELGLIEMTRKRVRESLGRTLNEPCSYCDGRGHVKSKQTMAYEIFREIRRNANNFREGAIVVNCHPDVARILQVEERDELRYLMDRFNKTIVVRPQQSYHQEQFEIFGKTDRQQRSRSDRDHRDGDRRHEREQRQAEQGSLKLTADRAPLRKPGEGQEKKPASAPLVEPQGRLSEYPPEKSGNHA